MSSMRVSVGLIGLCTPLMAAACGPRTPIKVGPDPVTAQRIADDFHKLLDEGCYLCLRDVIHHYEALDASMKEAPAVQDAANAAALVFMMRGRELSIPVDDDWREAQALVDAAAAESADYAFYAAVAQSFPWNAIGVGEDFSDAEVAGRPYPPLRLQDEWRARLVSMWQTSELAAYVDLSLDCELRPQKPVDMTPLKTQYASEPLIQYRWATCNAKSAPTLQTIIANDSRFYEAQYVLASRQAAALQYDEAQQNDLDAWKGIPRFTAAALSYANLALTAEEFDESRRAYEDVLVIVPTHRRAILGRVETLTYLEQYQAAAEGAHQMIALGNWYLGDAYYWLALNEYHLEETDQALKDAETAKSFESGARVHFLAGLIRMKQGAWTDAKQEFLDTIAEQSDYCDAMLDLGQADAALRNWPDGAQAFVNASTCYLTTRQSLEGDISRLSRESGARATRQLARRRSDLHDTIEKLAGSLYAAAASFTDAGNRDQALTFANRAVAFDSYSERAKALIALLQRGVPR